MSHLGQLERLDPELVPAILAARDVGNHGAVEHLRLLKKEWNANFELLLGGIDEILDCDEEFLRISEKQLKEDVEQCKISQQMEAAEIAESARDLIGGGRRFTQRAQMLMDKQTDPENRALIRNLNEQVNKVLPAIKTSANRLVNSPHDEDLHATLWKRCDLLLRAVAKVMKALTSGDTHLEWLSIAPIMTERRSMEDESELSSENKSGDYDENLTETDVDNSVLGITFTPNPEKYTPKHLPKLVAIDLDETPKRSNKKDIRKMAAMNTYIEEITNNNLRELADKLVTSAVAGQRHAVEEMLITASQEANHITELAQLLVKTVVGEKQMLSELLTEVISLTPLLMDKAMKVVDLDTYQLEALYVTANNWVTKLSYLLELIENIIQRWKCESDKVIEAAKFCNLPLLQVQLRALVLLEQATEELLNCLSNRLPLGGTNAIIRAEKLRQNKALMTDCKVNLMNLKKESIHFVESDVGKHPPGISINSLTRLGRTWAAKMFICASTIMRICLSDVERYMPLNAQEITNFHIAQNVVKEITMETVRWKELYEASNQDSDVSVLEDIDLLLGEMNELIDDMSVLVLHDKPVSQLLTSYKLHVLLHHWMSKILNLADLLKIDRILSPEGLSALISKNLYEASGKVTEAMEKSPDFEMKANMNHSLEELKMIAADLKNAEDNKQVLTVMRLKKLWQVKVQDLSCRVNLQSNQILTDVINGLRIAESPEIVQRTSSLPKKTSMQDPVVLLDDKDDVDSDYHSEHRQEYRKHSPSGQIKHGKHFPTSQPKHDKHSPTSQLKHGKHSPTSQSKQGKYSPTRQSKHDKHSPDSGENISRRFDISKFSSDASQWKDGDNPIVQVASDITLRIGDMTEYTKATEPTGLIQSRYELILCAKTIAADAALMVHFASVLAKHAIDKRLSQILLDEMAAIPGIASQLHMVASVKNATVNDRTTEKMLIQNAHNLRSAVWRMLQAAEAVSVKGFKEPEEKGALDSILLAAEWKNAYDSFIVEESQQANKDELGLRFVQRSQKIPMLSDIMSDR